MSQVSSSRLTKDKPPFHVVLIALYGVENAGVRYLSSHLKKIGHQVSVVFFREWRNNNNTFPDETDCRLLKDLLTDIKPDLVGFSFVSSFLSPARHLTRLVKENTQTPVVWGGIHASTRWEESLGDADFVIVGEGEDALGDLADALSARQKIHGIPNVGSVVDDRPVLTPVRNLIEDLNLLDLPDYGDEGKYLIDSGKLTTGDPARCGAEYRIYTSRGCPFRCAYCYNSILGEIYRGKGRYYRHRSPGHVVEELARARETFPRLRRIKFDDDTAFGFGREWIEEFCSLYRKKVGLPFECMIHPRMLRRETLLQLKDAGLKKVQVGIETSSNREGEEFFNRSPQPERIMEFARMNRELGLEVVYDAIIDNPGATEDDRRQLFDFLLELPRPYKLYLYSLTVFPGTPLEKDLLERGLISSAQIEGESRKGMTQFRVSFDWPRPAREQFWLSLYSMASKSFISRKLLRKIAENQNLMENPGVLILAAKLANLLRMAGIGWDMFRAGELTWFKIRQYASLRKMISQ